MCFLAIAGIVASLIVGALRLATYYKERRYHYTGKEWED